MKLSIETKLNAWLTFPDVTIFWENNIYEKFVHGVFRKDTFSGVYINFISFIPFEYKFGLVHTLLNRYFNLSSDLSKFHHDVVELKKILSKNAYPQKLIFIRYNSHTIFSLIPTFFMPLRNISFDPLTYKPKLFSSDLKHISKPIKPLSPCFCFKYSRSMSVFGCRAPYIVKVFLVFLYPFFSTHLHSSSI